MTPAPRPRPAPEPSHDELAARITSALRSRAAEPAPATLAALEARLAERPEVSPLAAAARRGGKIVAAGVVTSALAVAGAGAAAAANPYSEVARTVERAAQAVGITWSAMPEGYTREQYDAFWGAGYTPEDVLALEQLWQTGTTETKARAGQLLLDGLPVPVAPGGSPGALAGTAVEAFAAAGYTYDDAVALAALWQVETWDAKVRGGQAVLDGAALPLAPGEAEPTDDAGGVPGDAGRGSGRGVAGDPAGQPAEPPAATPGG